MIVKEHGRILAEFIHIMQHLGCGGIAVVNFQRHCPHDDLLQTAGDIGVICGRHGSAAVDMLNRNGYGRVAIIGRTACHHLIHHNTQGVDVGTGIYTTALCLLGRDVMYAAQSFLGKGVALGHHPGNTKVSDLYAAILQHHYVMGLDIPVDDATAVSMFQCFGDLNTKVEGFFPVQGTPSLHVLLQTNAFDQLHDDIVRHNGGRNIVD